MKYGLLSNHLFQRKQERGGWKEPQLNDKLLIKTMKNLLLRGLILKPAKRP